jgi:LytS/YehU family sensor histidine kinase
MLAGPYFASFLITTVVASASTVIVLWNNWTKAREHEQTITFEKVAAELSVLKLQISPHFLFNTLNNIRWLVRSKSEHAETAVVKLSHLLRYILYQTNQTKVPLEKEIEHLRDYVSLQQMRLAKPDSVSFELTGNPEGKQIVPLLFIPLVENFFKHANFEENFINKIKLNIGENHLTFETENIVLAPINKEVPGEDSGIGLENVKRRLMLNYPDQHLLRYENLNGKFTVHLEIILS